MCFPPTHSLLSPPGRGFLLVPHGGRYGFACLLAASAGAQSPTPNPIYDSTKYSHKLREVPNGVLYNVTAPGDADLLVMHLFGDASERGVAHGQLLSAEIAKFFTDDLAGFFKSEVDQIPLGFLPAWLAKVGGKQKMKLVKVRAP